MILTFFSADKNGIKSDMFASIQREWATLEKVFKAYTASLNGAKFSISDFNTALAQSKAKAEQEGEAVEGLTLKMVALRAGAMLLNVALNAIVSTVANFVITKFNEWRTAIETNAQKSKELSSSMTDLISQYKELGDKSGWDTDDFAQAKDLNAEILDLLKNQSVEMDKKLRKLDLENGKYQEQIDLLNELSISTLTQNKADQGKLLEQTAKGKSSGQYVIGDSSDIDMANALGGKFGGSLDSNTGVFNFGGFDPNDADSILAYYDKLSSALDYLGSNYDSATLEASNLYNQLKSEKNAIEDQANAYRSSSDTLKEVIAAQKLSSTSSKRSEEDIKAVTDALEGLKGAYGGVTSGNIVSFLSGDKKLGGTYADALNQLKEVMLHLGFDDNTSDAQAFVDVLVQLGVVSSSSASKVDGLSESTSAAADQLKEATDGLDKIQSAYSTLSDVVDEYNENGYLTVSTLTDLINLGPEYYDCLVNESGQLAINTENINTMADAYYEMAKAALYAQAIESLNANTNTYANASKFLSQAQQEVKDMKSLLYTEGQRLIDEGGLSGDALATQVQAQQRIINTYSAMMDLLDKTHAQSAENQFRNPKDKNSNKSSNSDDKMTDAVSAWKTLSAAMEEYNQYGNLCISTLNDLLGLEDDYTSLLTEQNGKMSINTTEFKNLMFAQIAQANATDESGKSAAELKRILQYVDENVKGDTISFEQLTDAIEGYGTAMDKAKQKTDAIKSAFSDLSDVGKNKIENPFGALDADDVDKQYQAIRDLYDNTDLFTDERFAGAMNPETGLIDYDSDAFKQMFLEKLDGMATACEKTGGKAGKYLAQGFRDAEDKIKNNVISIEEYINGIGSTLESINDRMDNFQSAFNDLFDIVNEYNAYGDLSQDSIQKLMALDTKYVGCLELQGDKLVFNKEAFKELYIAELKELALKYEGTEIGKHYADILQKVADGTWDVTDQMKGMGEEANRLNTIISNLKDLFSSLLDLVNNANDKKSNDLKIQGDAWIDVIDKRIDAINKENDAQERAIELAKAQDALDKARANKTVHVYKGKGQGFVWEADGNAVRDAQSTLNDTIRKNRKDEEIERLNKLKEKVQESTNLIGSSWEDYQKKLKYTAEFEKMTFDEMTGHYDTFKDSVLKNMQVVQTATNMSTVISNIEKLISTLNSLSNVLAWVTSGGQSTNGNGILGLFRTLKNTFVDEDGNIDIGGGLSNLFTKTKDAFSSTWKNILGVNKKGLTTLKKDTSADLTILGDTYKVGTSQFAQTAGGFWKNLLSNSVTKWNSLKNLCGNGLQSIVKTLGSMFSPIADGAQSIGNAISSGIISFFPSIFAGLGTLVTSVGGSMAAMMKAIAAALSSIPVVGWIAAGLAVAGAIALIASIASIASDVSNTQVNEPKPSFKAKKYAKGTRGVKKDQIANVDEQGEELIVRSPDQGRMTYLEKGDGVIPAKQTDNLMMIGADPEGWLAKELANNPTSTTGATSTAKEGLKQQVDNMRNTFESSWKDVAKELGITEEDIAATSNVMFNKMNEVMNNTFDAIDENTGLTAEQIEDLTNNMFDDLQDIYTSGWNSLASSTGNMTDEIADKLNNSYSKSISDTKTTANDISKVFANSWSKAGGGVKTLGVKVQKTLEESWADTSQDAEKLLYDVRACFDNGWSATSAGVTKMADKTSETFENGYADISSKASETFGANGTLSTEAKDAWKNVEPGAKSMSSNLDWMMNQSYEAIKQGSALAVEEIKNNLSTTGDAFKAVGNGADEAIKKAEEEKKKKEEEAKKEKKKTLTTGTSVAAGAAGGAAIGAAIGGPVGALLGGALGGVAGFLFGKSITKHAAGSKAVKDPHLANVDELGPEMLVRQPQSGRYTYLETGDGVVPADITSRLFEMGGNSDAWFQKQMAKYNSQNVAARGSGDITTSIGDIVITNPVGNVDALANEIKQKLPTKVAQMQSKR